MDLVSVCFSASHVRRKKSHKNQKINKPKNEPTAQPHLDELLLGLLHHLGRELRDRQVLDDLVLAVRARDRERVVETLVDAVRGAVRVHGHRGPLTLRDQRDNKYRNAHRQLRSHT